MIPIRSIFGIILLLVVGSQQVEIEVGRHYRIQNVDSAFLTVGGETNNGVPIITAERYTDSRDLKKQVFWIGSRIGIAVTVYEISPQAQNLPNSLVLEQNPESRLLYQQVRHFRGSQWWRIIDIGDGNWHIQNDQSGLCLSSQGGTQVLGELCSASATNQTWRFNVERRDSGCGIGKPCN